MAKAPYVDERKVEYWTSRELDIFFENEGFDVTVYPLTAVTEKQLPSDFIFMDNHSRKLFGFQYKTLYHNGRDYWNLNEAQHRQLAAFDWIYYGLSELTSAERHRNALHHLRVVPSRFDYESQLTYHHLQKHGVRYLRWAGFFEGLRTCKYGRKITDRNALRLALWPFAGNAPREIEQIVRDAFLVDFQNRRAAKFTSS